MNGVVTDVMALDHGRGCAYRDGVHRPVLKCGNCGALLAAPSGACSYCGALAAPQAAGDLIAAGFGDHATGWRAPKTLAQYGVAIDVSGDRSLQISVPAATEIGEAIIPAGYVRGEFADIDVAVTIEFPNPAPDGVAAGFWLRNDEDSALVVMLWPSGTVTIGARYEAGAHLEALGRAEPPAQYAAGAPHVVRARLVLDLITVYRDGHAVASVPCPADLHGSTELRVQVADTVRTVVRLVDPSARLP